MTRATEPGFSVPISEEGDLVLVAERLRDGRIALGTRRLVQGRWEPGETNFLPPAAYLALAAWLSGPVEDAWIDSIRDRQRDPLRSAEELFEDAVDGPQRLALEMIAQIPPGLLRRGLVMLVNSIGPEARERLVERLNRTSDSSEEAQLRRELAEGQESLAYAVAAAGLMDAVERGIAGPDLPDPDDNG